MTNNQLTDDRLVKILSETQATIMEHNSRCVRGSVEVDARLFESMIMELQERRKAAMDSEPVAEVLSSRPGNDTSTIDRALPVGTTLYRHAQPAPVSDYKPVAWLAIYHGEIYDDAIGITRSVVEAQADRFGWESALTEIIPLYRYVQPSPERDQIRREHAEWSQATFGNVGPVGPLKHLSKEALEAAAEPGDLSEWADLQFLMWDAQRRAGITDEQITQAMVEKLAVNKRREWPEPKDGEPRLHIKEQPAPVMPNFKKLARELVENLVDCGGLDAGVKEKYLKWTEKTCRAAMIAAAQQEVK